MPWLLIALLLSYAIPFALIADKGDTSARFVLDRLDQPMMWLFASLYMGTLVFLSVDSIRMLRRPRGVLLVIAAGYIAVTVGCVIEIVYLAAAHFGVGGVAFRVSMYYASEFPFFAGIFTIGLAITWNALRTWSRFRWSLVELLRLTQQKDLAEWTVGETVRMTFGPDPRRIAFRLLIELQNSLEVGAIELSARERAQLNRIRSRFKPEEARETEETLGMPA